MPGSTLARLGLGLDMYDFREQRSLGIELGLGLGLGLGLDMLTVGSGLDRGFFRKESRTGIRAQARLVTM